MPDTTFEEAKRCPRCKVPGEVVSKVPGDRSSVVHIVKCQTPGCRWHDTTWLVQVNRDGSIPIRKKGEKDLKPLEEYQKQKARDKIRQHKEWEERGEIGRP